MCLSVKDRRRSANKLHGQTETAYLDLLGIRPSISAVYSYIVLVTMESVLCCFRRRGRFYRFDCYEVIVISFPLIVSTIIIFSL